MMIPIHGHRLPPIPRPGILGAMPRRLAYRLIFSLTFIVVLAEGISSYISVHTQEQQLLSAMTLGADQLSRGIASATWESMLADHRDAAYSVMRTVAEKQGIDRIRFFNKEGLITFSTGPDSGAIVDKSAEACYVCHATQQPLVTVDVPTRARIFTGVDGKRRLGMITAVYNEPECSNAACHAHHTDQRVLGVLDVSLQLEPVDEEVAAIVRGTVGMMAIHVLVISLFIFYFTRRFVDRPIQGLIDATNKMSIMKLDEPIAVESSEELGALARSFNAMRIQLNRAIHELNEVTQGLEQKVRERTRELEVAQERLVRADRMASLGQLAASIAHEINNPVWGILNLSMLLDRMLKEDGVPKERLAEFRSHLSHVISETSRVGRIVSDLLSFSRRSKPRREKTNLNTIIQSTVSLLHHRLELGNVEISLRLADHLPDVFADPSQLQQVVLNLVMNSMEACQRHERGVITVWTAYSRDRKVVLEAGDDGEGMSEEQQRHIFEPFFTTKEDGKGVGLGLAVVYGIVQAHEGDIEVHSSLGKGTTFRITLPEYHEADALVSVAAAPGTTTRDDSPAGSDRQR